MARLVSLATFAAALLYIVRLRRELADARARGDMYRDIATSLDREQKSSGN